MTAEVNTQLATEGCTLPDGSVLVVFWCVQPDGRGAERPGVGYVRVAMEP